MAAFSVEEIGLALSAVSKAKIAELRAMADQLMAETHRSISKAGTKFDIATRMVPLYEEWCELVDEEAADNAPRPFRVLLERVNRTRRMSNWGTEAEARAFADEALRSGRYRAATFIDLDGNMEEMT